MLTNKKLWRVVSWPVLITTTLFVLMTPEWFDSYQAWAQQPPDWSETDVPMEWSTRNQDGSDIQALRSQASALGNHPVLIYEFVRNEIEYEPYTGTRFGALGTLERRRGNDADQAILLAALLRAAYRNLSLDEPNLWLVRGDIKLTGEQALNWLGVSSGSAVTSYLSASGVQFTLSGNPSGSGFELLLKDHVWLRGDLEFGPYSGTRFVEGDDGILADLDPSFVVKRVVEGLPTPFDLTGIDPAVFAQQVAGFAQMDAAQGSVRDIPEAVMLNMIESGAAVFRRYLRDNSLSAEQALEQRQTTIEQIDVLPGALPFTLASSPQTFKLKNEAERDDFLSRARHKAQVRVMSAGGGAPLAEALVPTSELYGKTFAVGFRAVGAVTSEVLAGANLEMSDLPDLTAEITLNGEAIGTAVSQTLIYGSPTRLEFAYQPGSFQFDPENRPVPMEDASASKEVIETLAGGVYALAALPGLNDSSQRSYYQRSLSLSGPAPEGATPAKTLGPSLDLAAQVMLSQTENFIRLGALASGHRASTTGQWTIAGLEPVEADNGGSVSYRTPRFVFASAQGKIPLGKVIEDSMSPKNSSTPAVQALLQLSRDAQLFHAASIAYGEAAQAVSAGKILRDANRAFHPEGTLGSPTYAVDSANADLLDPGMSSDRVPSGGALTANLQARADQGDLLIMPSVQTTLNSELNTTNSLGQGWGYHARRSDNTWSSSVRTTDGLLLRAFSEQKVDLKINPAELVAMDAGSAMHYRRLAEKTINGAELYLGASKSTSQAYVSAVLPLLAVIGPDGSGGTGAQSSKALGVGSAIMLLHALMEEFARPEVLGMKLQLGASPEAPEFVPGPELTPGGVFNPAYYDDIAAIGELSEIVETYKFFAYDGPNIEQGRFAGADPTERSVRWTMKSDADPTTDVFGFVPGYNAATDGSDYNGPVQIRLEGALNGQKTRQVPFEFTIDTRAPDISILPWDQDREYRGDIAIRGSATDLHFKDYKVEIRPSTEPDSSYRELLVSESQALGAATLAIWKAREENATGDFTFRLSAVDQAGNTTFTLASLSVRNDSLGPDLQIVSPSTTPLFGQAGIRVEANDGISGTGVRKLKVSIEFSRRDTPDKAYAVHEHQVETLWDQTYSAPQQTASFPSDGTSTYSIDTREYQISANSPFVIHAEAEDAYGNITTTSKNYTINNVLFDAYLSRGIIFPGSPTLPPPFGAGRIAATEVYVFQSTAQPPLVELYNSSGTLIRPLVKYYPSGSPNAAFIDSRGTYLATYAFNGLKIPSGDERFSSFDHPTENFTADDYVPPGSYIIRVTQGSESMDLPLIVRLESPFDNPPRAHIAQPLNTILLKDKTPEVPITGWISSDLLEMNNGRSDELPIGRLLPAERPYWLLSYKPSDVDPTISTAGNASYSFIDNENFKHEANWKEIAHGFSEMPLNVDPGPPGTPPDDVTTTTTLGLWDISKLPVGEYDVRLVVTDGVLYRTLVIPGYKITNSAVTPGEDPDDREPGVLKLRQVDFSVPFEGFPVEIARTYNSFRSGTIGDFGYGWNLDGITLDISQTKNEVTSFGERLEATITLPDGRKFNYANEPATSAQLLANPNFNAWIKHEAFISRPYGQMLWLPGRDHGYGGELNGVYAGQRNSTPGYVRVQAYRGGVPPDGSIACLQLENGSFILFEWLTGKILQQNYADGTRKVDYTYSNIAAAAATNGKLSEQILIQDHLGRNIKVERDKASGLVTKITDPRGFYFKYEYNAKKELARVYDRNGNLRELFYGENVPDEDNPDKFFKMPEHYLTRMVIRRTDNEGSPNDTVIKYKYDTDGRLGGIDTGDGEIEMEYAPTPGGGGTQIVHDEATGGSTIVEYDAAGRATRQVDPAGVVTSYDYNPDLPEGATPGEYDAKPPGALKSQTVGGVTTSFEYDLSPYRFQSRGYDQMADNYIDFWLNRASGGQITDDYEADNVTLRSGYLTSQQVQPTMVKTPAIRNGISNHAYPQVTSIPETQPNQVASRYHDLVNRPDGTGKIFGVTDPEGRAIGLDYGQNAVTHNENTTIKGPAETEVKNTYVQSGDFTGRIASSLTTRGTETLSTTNYTYSHGRIATYVELAAQIDLVVDHLDDLNLDFVTIWPDYANAYIEKQFVETIFNDNESSSTTYLDALGNTLAVMAGSGDWSLTISNGDGRALFAKSADGSIITNTYDQSGLLARTININAENEITGTTTYAYDAQGRERAAIRLDASGRQITTTTDYGTDSSGRSRTVTDDRNNKTTVVTDAAGRTVREIFVGSSGNRRETITAYDPHGRLDHTISPRGLVTIHVYDEAGREVTTVERAEGRDITTRRGYDGSNRLLWDQSPLQAKAAPPRFRTYLYKLDKPSANLTSWTTLDDTTGVNDTAYGQLVRVCLEDDDPNPNNNAGYAGCFEEYEYDSKGRQTAVTKPIQLVEGGPVIPVTTRTSFNDDDRATSVIMADNSPEAITFQFAYDSQGNRSEVTYPSGLTKKWDHIFNDDPEDDLDRLIESQPGPAGSASPWKTILYNVDGQREQITDNVGNRIAFFYADFQLERKTYTLADLIPAFNHRYSYDDRGRVKDIRTYDGEGDASLLRMESRSYDPETDRLSSVSKDEGTIRYTFDDSGSLGSMSHYGHTVGYEYDFWGRLSRAASPEAEWTWRYNDVGQKARVENIVKRTTEERTYDSLGRLLGVRHSRMGEAEPIFEIAYSLGVDGTRIGATETRGTEVVTWAYRYDLLGRLTRETRTSSSQPRDVSYTYDSDGNRLTETDELLGSSNPNRTKQYFYEPDSHRLDRIERNGAVISDFAWTANGEVASKTESSQAQSYTWGPDGTLRSVAFSTGERVEYDYDSFGELIRRREFADSSDTPSSDRRYLIDNQNLTGYTQRLAEIDAATGAVQVLNTFTDDVSAQTMARSDNARGERFLHADGLGSIRAATSDGSSEPYDYSAFGNLIRGEQSLMPFAFTGQTVDAVTNLQHHRARWYSPSFSAWLSPDSLLDLQGNFGNSYSYVGQSPIARIDPSGNLTLLEVVGSAAISATINVLAYLIQAGLSAKDEATLQGAIIQGVIGGVFGALGAFIGPVIGPLMKFINAPMIRLFVLGFVGAILNCLEFIASLHFAPQEELDSDPGSYLFAFSVVAMLGFVGGFFGGLSFTLKSLRTGVIRRAALKIAKNHDVVDAVQRALDNLDLDFAYDVTSLTYWLQDFLREVPRSVDNIVNVASRDLIQYRVFKTFERIGTTPITGKFIGGDFALEFLDAFTELRVIGDIILGETISELGGVIPTNWYQSIADTYLGKMNEDEDDD